ncbi:Endomembrane protein 70-domain-containing protein [Zopfochytrium polystomum]|nr:Endomembrane protein 70-domain-containing protein [Zopfochytrium polystomum]
MPLATGGRPPPPPPPPPRSCSGGGRGRGFPRRLSRRSRIASVVAAFAACALIAPTAGAFYLPGEAPVDYRKDDRVELLVNALSSPETIFPYDQYHPRLHFCPPDNGPRPQAESLGSSLFGDRLYDSRFNIRMLEDKTCSTLCEAEVKVSPADAAFVNGLIRARYNMNWLVDHLPTATVVKDRHGREQYNLGFEMGELVGEKPALHNHFNFVISYNALKNDLFRVVGFAVYPSSAAHVSDCAITPETPKLYLSEDSTTSFSYTYSVKWVKSETEWSARWEKYLSLNASASEPRIHWFSLINSVVIVIFLSGMVVLNLLPSVRKDIARYNSVDLESESIDDSGWKLVHGDVFRNPPHSSWLAVLVGSGAQMSAMTFLTLFFAALGVLSPSLGGSLPTMMIVAYVMFGSVAGYSSARIYRAFGGTNLNKNVLATALLIPGTIFAVFILLNFFLIAALSSGAVPIGTMIVLFAMWFLVSLPLCAIGAYLGFNQPKIEHPVRTNQIPRQIPPQPIYLQPIPVMLLGGVLPFGAIFIELFYILNSLWAHKIYYVFGFTFVVFLIMIITSMEVAILLCYFLLCSENYNWWWRSFLAPGTSALYVFIYGMYYSASRAKMDGIASVILYGGWTLLMSLIVFLWTGSAGFAACYVFVRKIYSSIKVD